MTIQEYVNNFCNGSLMIYFSDQSIQSGEYKGKVDDDYFFITNPITNKSLKFSMKNIEYDIFNKNNYNNHSVKVQVLTTKLKFILLKKN